MPIWMVGIRVQCCTNVHMSTFNFQIGNLIMQNSFNSLQELATEVERLDLIKRDYTLPSRAGFVDPDGRTMTLHSYAHMGDEFQGQMSDQFIKLFCGWSGMSEKYHGLMVEREKPELIAVNMNTWLNNPPKGSGNRLFRTYDHGGDGNVFRSFHSDRFYTFDNFDLLDGITPVLERLEERMGEVEFVSMGLTDDKMYLKIIFPEVDGEILKQGRSVGDIVQSGVLISNSEVGMGSIVVSPFIYRLICLNGMVMNDSGLRKIHLGQTRAVGEIAYKRDTIQAMHEALKKQLRDHVEECTQPEQFEKAVRKIQDAADDNVVKDGKEEDVVDNLGKKYSLADSEVKKVKRALFENGDFSRWGFANAVTHVANSCDNYDRASDLQETGGKVIEMSKSEWTVLAKAA